MARRTKTNSLPTSPETSQNPRSETLADILGPVPLLPDEDRAAYDQLTDRFYEHVQPKDLIEELWLRDVVDLVWQGQRLRRLKANLRIAAIATGVESVIRKLSAFDFDADRLVENWLQGYPNARKETAQLMKRAGYNDGVIEAEAFIARFADFDNLERMITQTDSRRAAILREMDRHRDMVSRRLREALSIEDAEFEDVDAKAA
jgi:hypothetical protein